MVTLELPLAAAMPSLPVINVPCVHTVPNKGVDARERHACMKGVIMQY